MSYVIQIILEVHLVVASVLHPNECHHSSCGNASMSLQLTFAPREEVPECSNEVRVFDVWSSWWSVAVHGLDF
jgi:hypothetical protein